MTERLRIATRGSRLARAQARAVADALAAAWPELDISLEVVRTRGDALVDRPVEEIGRGAFVREVQVAVLERRADVAVHSYKDLPTERPDGLAVAAVPPRADARDALVSRGDRAMQYLPAGARIGTGSPRRAAQLRRWRSDLDIRPIRGNVDTRLDLLDDGALDALVLAAAGLDRIGRAERIAERFGLGQMIPAPGQGALALEIRLDDARTAERLAPLDDPRTANAVRAERVCLARLGGGCLVPIGVHATTDGDTMIARGIVATPDGTHAARLRWSGPWQRADDVGATLAELLLASGAAEILSGRPIPDTPHYAARRGPSA